MASGHPTADASARYRVPGTATLLPTPASDGARSPPRPAPPSPASLDQPGGQLGDPLGGAGRAQPFAYHPESLALAASHRMVGIEEWQHALGQCVGRRAPLQQLGRDLVTGDEIHETDPGHAQHAERDERRNWMDA